MMTGQNFKEVLGTVCMSTNSTIAKVAKASGFNPHNFYQWRLIGVPVYMKPYVMDKLRKYLFSNLGVY